MVRATDDPTAAAVSLGTARRILERAEHVVSEVSIPGDSGELEPHRHVRAQIHLVLEGEYSESARGAAHRLGPGSVLFRPAGEVHSNAFGEEEVHGILVELAEETPAMLLLGAFREPFYFVTHAVEPLRIAFGRETRRRDRETAAAVAGLTLWLTAEVSRLGRRPEPPAWLRDAAALVRRRFSEDLRLSRLAAVVGVPAVRLAAAFRRHFGCSVGEYLLRARLSRARRLLRDSRASLASIAAECGFFDQAHFSRAFRKFHATTPSEYRRTRGA
jgi:AraC family transcriptional regulator